MQHSTACLWNLAKRFYRLCPAKCPPKWMLDFPSTFKVPSTKPYTSLRSAPTFQIQRDNADDLQLYKSIGIDKSRVLIKLASTWEGVKAAHVLQSEHGVNCNLTLMFSLPQAIAAAEAGAFLISPFVGRILDWYKAANKKDYSAQEDPGVKSVQQIFNYYKKYDYKTIVMGASFRNVGEITELAGCDYLTISVSGLRFSPWVLIANPNHQPNYLEDLYNSTDKIPQKLISSDAKSLDIPKKSYINDEAKFRFDFNEEAMAVEKLREGISKFAADAITLKGILAEKIKNA